MPRRRFFVPPDRILHRAATLPPDQAHHLVHVLRIRAGDEIEIFDGRGGAYTGIVETNGAEVCVSGLVPVPQRAGPSGRSIVLGAALIKSDRFEWVIQKGTELGIDALVPLETRRCSTAVPEDRRASRLQRWRTIAEESAKQCRRDSVPVIHPISTFHDLLAGQSFQGVARYLCYEQSSIPWTEEFLGSEGVLLCIGPEGGWDPAEVTAAAAAGFRDFSLGIRTLRSETAALAALTLFQLQRSASGVSINI